MRTRCHRCLAVLLIISYCANAIKHDHTPTLAGLYDASIKLQNDEVDRLRDQTAGMKFDANQNILALSGDNVGSLAASRQSEESQREGAITNQLEELDRLESPMTLDVDEGNEVIPTSRQIRVHAAASARSNDESNPQSRKARSEAVLSTFLQVWKRRAGDGLRREKEIVLEEAEESGGDNEGDVAARDLSFKAQTAGVLKRVLLIGTEAAGSLTKFQWVYLLVIVPVGILVIMSSLILFS